VNIIIRICTLLTELEKSRVTVICKKQKPQDKFFLLGLKLLKN